jgi:hypothetical protein
MSEKRLDPVAWSAARQHIGHLLRELYDQPQEFSPQLVALIAKLEENGLQESGSASAEERSTHPSS